MRTRHALSFGLVSLLALVSTVAFADTLATTPIKQSNAAQVLLVGSGAKLGRITGEMKLRYPGYEQTKVVHSRGYMVMISMEAVEERDRGPVQCSCASYQLQENGPPKLVTPLKRLTEYSNGERTCNHPTAAADENGNIVWGYGSDYNNNRPNTYAGIINEKCEQLAAPIMVNARTADGQSRDANDGAFDVQYLGGGRFVGAYYSDGGGVTGPFPAAGGDYAVAMGLSIQGGVLPTLKRDWVKDVIEGGTIMRPTVAVADANRAVVCAAQGGNRPPERIQCSLVDTVSGNVITKNTFFDSKEGEGRKYYNQPTIVKISDNQFALLAAESNGMGKGTNIKGTNTTHIRMIERNGDALIPGGEIVGVGDHQTHASLCSGGYGEQGAPAVGVFSGPPTGIGRNSIAMVQYDAAGKTFKFDAKADSWPVSWVGDSGHLSNWYGRNPMRQGRDFLNCIGSVPNPGYQKANGYMSDVKTFFVAAVHGREFGNEKNSLFLSLVPGQMDKKPTPSSPVVAGEPGTTENDGATTDTGPKSDSGCGCETVGARSTSTGSAALLGFGVALGLVVSRRRRNG